MQRPGHFFPLFSPFAAVSESWKDTSRGEPKHHAAPGRRSEQVLGSSQGGFLLFIWIRLKNLPLRNSVIVFFRKGWTDADTESSLSLEG